MCTTRGYILDVWGNYGGNGACSDEAIWKDVMDKIETEEKESDESDKLYNVKTFFKNVDGQKLLFVVDRGFRSAEDSNPAHWEFKAPLGKRKTKVKTTGGRTKTKEVPQLEPEEADNNRFVTKLRNIIERINKIAIKRWKLLGETLSWQYLDKVEDLCKIAAALWNRFHSLEEDGEMDMEDYAQMKARFGHKNEIPKLLAKKKLSWSGPAFERLLEKDEEIFANLTEKDIRRWATGPYAIKLSAPYLQQARDLEKNYRFLVPTNAGRAIPKNKFLLKLNGLRSRFSPKKKGRLVHLLFTKQDGEYHITDTLCSCDGGQRSTSCAHGICALRYLWELRNDAESAQAVKSRYVVLNMHSEICGSDSEFDSDDDD